jgi:oligopeptide transport system substrate-binding protein
LNSEVLGGISTPATSFTPKGLYTTPSGTDFASYAKQAYTYDAAKAKKLWQEGLKELGVSSLTLTFEADTDRVANAKQVVEYLNGAWTKALPGLKIEEKFVTFKQRLKDGPTGNFDIMLTRWGADYAEPTTYLDLVKTGNSNNWGSFSNSAYDSALAKAESTDATNDTARSADEKKAEQIIYEKAAINPLYYQATPQLVRTNVKGIIYNTAGLGIDYKYAVRK